MAKKKVVKKQEDKKVETKKEGKELELKLRKKHPNKKFRIGSVEVVGYQFKKYILNEKELIELQDKGVQTWVVCKELEEAKK